MANRTEIAVILDRSGSMQTIRTDAIGGFNSFLEVQKAVPGEAKFSLVLFDNHYETPILRKDLKAVEPLTDKTFAPRGSTALYDAIGRTVNTLGAELANLPDAERPSKVIVAILTDGMENASREFNQAQIAEMVKHQEEKYSWEFIYLGANQDAFAVSGALGMRAENTANFSADSIGTRSAYETVSRLTTSYRTKN